MLQAGTAVRCSIEWKGENMKHNVTDNLEQCTVPTDMLICYVRTNKVCLYLLTVCVAIPDAIERCFTQDQQAIKFCNPSQE